MTRAKTPTEDRHLPSRLLPSFVGQPGQACTDADTEIFFDPEKEAEAKAICNTGPCKWRQKCLQFALHATKSLQFDAGIWGGTSPTDRQQIRLGEIQPAAKVIVKRSDRENRPATPARKAPRSRFYLYPPEIQVAQRAECIRRYRNGEPIIHIARALGVSHQTVRQRLGPALVRTFPAGRAITPEQEAAEAARCLELRREGLALRAIARQVGIGIKAVRRRLAEADRADQAPAA